MCVHHKLKNLITSGKVQYDSFLYFVILIIKIGFASTGTWAILEKLPFYKNKEVIHLFIHVNPTDSKEYKICCLFLFTKYVP